MFNKEEVIKFFDKYSASWDENMVIDENIISTIFNNAHIKKGNDVLDIACGTGVLIPFYLNKDVNSVTAIDISPKMIEIAKNKFKDNKINIICDDAEIYNFNKKFDSIVIYNAYPHFPDGENLIKHLSSFLKENGTLTIAHGTSKEKINEHHSGSASLISNGLPSIGELEKIFIKYLKVTTKIDNQKMYQIVGEKHD